MPLGPWRDAPDESHGHRRQVHVRRRSGECRIRLSAADQFDVGGKKKMMTFEVRHWISPHEAGIAEGKPGNTVGNQFYGSNGYLVMDGDKYDSFLGRDEKPGPAAEVLGVVIHRRWILHVRSDSRRIILSAERATGAAFHVSVHSQGRDGQNGVGTRKSPGRLDHRVTRRQTYCGQRSQPAEQRLVGECALNTKGPARQPTSNRLEPLMSHNPTARRRP